MTQYDDRQDAIREQLQLALAKAQSKFQSQNESETFSLPTKLRKSLDKINDNADSSATTIFNNLVTGLAIKAAYPNLDTRFHQTQIQKPAHFNHRNISEKTVYPFLRENNLDGAKSGWQTRTLERPKPYMLDYDENIKGPKTEFLAAYHAMTDGGEKAIEMLKYLFLGQVIRREQKNIDVIAPKIDDIGKIVAFFEEHFSASYHGKGAARLPVLAIYSLYQLMIPQLSRFQGLNLANLELHSAADSQTGATGDIEISRADGSIFEAIEVKHHIPVSEDLVLDAAQKLTARQVDRFYVLTTHPDCGHTDEISRKTSELKERTGCQIIVNGVIPTLRYSLRLVSDPAAIFQSYTALMNSDPAIGHEHRVQWNNIVLAA